jgi:hypothetical protein
MCLKHILHLEIAGECCFGLPAISEADLGSYRHRKRYYDRNDTHVPLF